jgi:tRNA pseudouridine-54 N-methylase
MFPSKSRVEVNGPDGKLEITEHATGTAAHASATVTRAGRYAVTVDGDEQERFVTVTDREITTPSHDPADLTPTVQSGAMRTKVDASSDFALVLLGLFVGEIALRALRRRGRTRRERRRTAVSG